DPRPGKSSSAPRRRLRGAFEDLLIRKRRRPAVGPESRTAGRQEKIPAATYSPTRKPCSTIGSGGLNFRVRYGNGWNPSDVATGNLSRASARQPGPHGWNDGRPNEVPRKLVSSFDERICASNRVAGHSTALDPDLRKSGTER